MSDIAKGNQGIVAAVTVAVMLPLLAGCADGPPLGCLDDSPACVSQRTKTFETLVADSSHSWVADTPDAAAFATGVRLFAYRRNQGKLSCAQLASGISETGRARQILAAGVPGVSKTRLGQIVSLSDDVNAELKKTSHRKRCGAA